MAKAPDDQTLMLSKTTKIKPSTNYIPVPIGTVNGGHVFIRIVLKDHAMICHLTNNAGTTTAQQHSVSSSQTI